MNGSFEYALSRQIPKEKLVLGIPFYGRSFDCSGMYQKFQKSNYYSYAQVMELIKSGWAYNWDNCAQVPYVLRPDKKEIASFDDARSVSLKCKFIKDNDAAGIIIWELSEDYYQDSSTLLRVVGEEFTADR
jgi:chitinase